MAEVMAKSKEHKLRRQMEKAQEEGIRAELDDQFADLRELLFTTTPVERMDVDGPASNPDAAILSVPEAQDTAYDQRVRELAFDKRSKPKDRTKTEEELALEAKEALERAERRRQRRMEGLPESEDEEDGKGRNKRKRGGDDLEDDFMDDEAWGGLGAGLDRAHAEDDDGDEESEGDEEDSEDEDGGDEDDGKSEESDEESDEESEVEGEHEELVKSTKVDKGKGRVKPKSRELPFTFPCPETHEEFLEIIEDIEDKDLPMVLQRMRALYHTSLAPENKFKLQVCCMYCIRMTLSNLLSDSRQCPHRPHPLCLFAVPAKA